MTPVFYLLFLSLPSSVPGVATLPSAAAIAPSSRQPELPPGPVLNERMNGQGAHGGILLHVRLTSAIGSYASKAGTAFSAVLIAPVHLNSGTILPAGSTLSGDVKSVKRVGFGIWHETAGIDLEFTRIALPGGIAQPISAKVADVDNARETVTREGEIREVRTTSTLCYRFSGYIRTLVLWNVHAELAEWLVKSLIVQVPEPEIYFPPGVELTLRLTAPLKMADPREPEVATARLSSTERREIADMILALPVRSYAGGTNQPSDLINVLFAGSREELTKSFLAAGWVEARRSSFRSAFRGIAAVAENRGFRYAPMSTLLVNDAAPDMSWEKSFDDFSKRDHIRIWKQPGTWRGREIWIGAATHDIDYAYLRRRRQPMTHQVNANIDEEREKVINDLDFTSCLDLRDEVARQNVPGVVWNATGDFMNTDGRLAVVGLGDCRAPERDIAEMAAPALAVHGNRFQRFARREILSARSDLIRANIYWRSYEGTRWAITAMVHHHRVALARREAREKTEASLQAAAAPVPSSLKSAAGSF
ncbi:MAG: LssY C-terminal domain-containing protein [Bryobacteraceae bacterium]